jgi:hypothetical protein
VNGYVLSQKVVPSTNHSILEKLDVSNLSPGVYTIELENGQGREVTKIVK